MFNPHAKEIGEILHELATQSKGLKEQEVSKRLLEYGPNSLPDTDKVSVFKIIINNVNNFLTYILASVALLSLFLGHEIDAIIIGVVIFINVFIAVRHELKAISTISGLKALATPKCTVVRDGVAQKIESSQLVPGDIVLLKEGDKVPADLRLIQSIELAAIESSLTGESASVAKHIKALPLNTQLGDRRNMAYMGTLIVAGEATGVVVMTGSHTELGKIASQITEIKEEKTLFDIRVDNLMRIIVYIAIASAAFTFLIGLIRQIALADLFLFTAASVISTIPEGLPAVLTIALSIAAHRMAVRKTVVRNLSAIESLSSVTTIVTDKTGTLTQNTMTVEKIYLGDGRDISITGKGYEFIGDFLENEKVIKETDKYLAQIMPFIALANNAQVIEGPGNNQIIGDPTEASRLVLAGKLGFHKFELLNDNYEILDEKPYQQDTKYRVALIRDKKEKKNYLIAVGAAEKVLAKSTHQLDGSLSGAKFTIGSKREIETRIKSWTKEAMRLQSLAYKEVKYDKIKLSDLEGFTFAMLLGITDPIRDDVFEAVTLARTAGIRVIMATGDHKDTAIAIAKKVGIIDSTVVNVDGTNPFVAKSLAKALAYSEDELSEMSEEEFTNAVMHTNVFARLTPSTKLRIAETLQAQGEIVAMTGDGVNDAMAIKKANVGISMGTIGTDAAREASDLIIMDDNFATIVSAIEEGLTVFRNIKQTSTYLITTNMAEDFFIILSIAVGTPLPLLPIQILWLNLLTDGLLDVSLAMEKPHDDVWKNGIISKKAGILDRDSLIVIGINVLLIGLIGYGVFNFFLPDGVEKARTAVFGVLTFSQIFFAFNTRSLRNSLFKIGFLSNMYVLIAGGASIILAIILIEVPFLQAIFKFETLSFIEIVVLFAISTNVLVVGEIYKHWRYR